MISTSYKKTDKIVGYSVALGWLCGPTRLQGVCMSVVGSVSKCRLDRVSESKEVERDRRRMEDFSSTGRQHHFSAGEKGGARTAEDRTLRRGEGQQLRGG